MAYTDAIGFLTALEHAGLAPAAAALVLAPRRGPAGAGALTGRRGPVGWRPPAGGRRGADPPLGGLPLTLAERRERETLELWSTPPE